MTTTIGDLVQSGQLRRSIAQTKQQIQILTAEVTEGIATDTARHLGGDLGALHAIRGSMLRLQGYDTATTEMAVLASATQEAVQSVAGFATGLATTLMSAGTFGQSGTLQALGAEAAEKFRATVSLLNTRVGDRALFSGVATDRSPLPDGAAVLQTLSSQVAGLTTAAAVRTTIDAWFDGAGGYAAAYGGAADFVATEVAEGERVVLAVSAQTAALRDTLKSFAMAAMLGDEGPPLDTAERASLASTAGAALIEGATARADLTADLALIEGRIEAAKSRNSAEAGALEIAQAKLVEVDPYQASTLLADAQTRLETIFAVTARLSSLALVNFLR